MYNLENNIFKKRGINMKLSKKLFTLSAAMFLCTSISVATRAQSSTVDAKDHWNMETETSYYNTKKEPLYTDHHMHMMSNEYSKFFKKLTGNDLYFGTPVCEVSGDKIISLLDEANMDRAFVLSGSYILGMNGIEGSTEYEDVKKENNYLAIEVAKHPDRLIGFFSVNPLKDYAIEEIDRCFDKLQLSGLKLHFTNSNVDLNNPEHLNKIKTLFAHCADKNIPILLHFKSRSPEYGKKDAEILIDEIIANTPNLKLQIAHLGGWGGFDKSTQEVFSTFIEKFDTNPELKKENIYFDFSGIIVTKREFTPGALDITSVENHKMIAEMLKKWGLDNIAFGTDYQYQTPKAYLEYLKNYLPLTEKELEDILDNDFTKIFVTESNGEIRHPDINELNKFLKDGIDYNAPFSTEY